MSNAAAAYYTYLAQKDRDLVKTLRRFGCYASADHVERRAERHEREARRQASYAETLTPLPSPLDQA